LAIPAKAIMDDGLRRRDCTWREPETELRNEKEELRMKAKIVAAFVFAFTISAFIPNS
jgi:hypothetical protein